jgi:23S rRNA (cytidine1920-2'-O)/16S rRNA (cytidine1409-2'-O)-methyltransferase
VRERTNVRTLTPTATEGTFLLVVADLSFISLTTVARALVGLTDTDTDTDTHTHTDAGSPGHLLVLVKPQFEAGRVEVSRGRGVIRDPAIRRRTLSEVQAAFAEAGATATGALRSPLRGGDGNVEVFLHLRPTPHAGPPLDPAALDAVVGD